ncbi:unnamed protein product [Caenorhabditis angaria]|uniref:Endonuclease/exonuclease/phosphatase domain-containing protein n=1 Tax=Caenorhabditis angaria TaxID=860376 RepID=A0A9P1I7Q0_9PELO|nr:unnamed protein product [Caenorhabditis angaria]
MHLLTPGRGLDDSEVPNKKSKIVTLSDNEEDNNDIEIIRDISSSKTTDDISENLKRALDDFYGSEEFKDIRTQAVMGAPSSSSAVSAPMTAEDLKGFEISVMSWNVDGLDGRSLLTRMRAVGKIVKMVNPDVLFLQEVVDRDIEPIDKLQSLYKIYYSNKGCQYYTAILVSKMFDVEKHDVIHYQNSGMYRTLQVLEGSIGGLKVFLLNTHLELMKEHATQRRAQFAFCMDKVREIISKNPGCCLFFCGDLNIRDDVISSIPNGVKDAWIAAGMEKTTQWTWDTSKNDNKQAKYGAKCRFDRLYWHAPLNKVKFNLEGRQRIRSCLCFPSDHWAINAVFSAYLLIYQT